ncbi:Uma2 family endonuclease [Thiospirillum jenense]|uniref:Uma2 family endonuclease n=1 Tax=Thiospirillum jenense TaxID=1653858 RepID=A0A839HK07_9GAMM|nr:Uma2 family endonuclease [Thiospirillum jenense]
MYHCLGELGLFNDATHVELIEGELFSMSPTGAFHAGYVKRLNYLLMIN